LVVNGDDVVVQRPVQIGALFDSMRVIKQGLSAGDWVVVDGLQRAIPGSKVKPHKAASVSAKRKAAMAADATPESASVGARQPPAQP
jgi:hypothetical protein